MKLALTPWEVRVILSKRARGFVRPERVASVGDLIMLEGIEYTVVSVTPHRLSFLKSTMHQDLGHDDGEGFRLHWKKTHPGKWREEDQVYVHRLREVGASMATYSRQMPRAQRTLEEGMQ